MALASRLLSFSLTLVLIGCPPAINEDIDGVPVPIIVVNNGVTQLQYPMAHSYQFYYSRTPEVHNSWIDGNGRSVRNDSSSNFGQRLTQYWENNLITEKGKDIIEQFNSVNPEEEDVGND